MIIVGNQKWLWIIGRFGDWEDEVSVQIRARAKSTRWFLDSSTFQALVDSVNWNLCWWKARPPMKLVEDPRCTKLARTPWLTTKIRFQILTRTNPKIIYPIRLFKFITFIASSEKLENHLKNPPLLWHYSPFYLCL